MPFRCVFKTHTHTHVLAEGLSSQKSITTTIRDQLMSSNRRLTRKDQTLKHDAATNYNFPFMIWWFGEKMTNSYSSGFFISNFFFYFFFLFCPVKLLFPSLVHFYLHIISHVKTSIYTFVYFFYLLFIYFLTMK